MWDKFKSASLTREPASVSSQGGMISIKLTENDPKSRLSRIKDMQRNNEHEKCEYINQSTNFVE